jgi:hypothetical protein
MEDDELDQAALENQREAALDDLAESCRSLLEQVLTENVSVFVIAIFCNTYLLGKKHLAY